MNKVQLQDVFNPPDVLKLYNNVEPIVRNWVKHIKPNDTLSDRQFSFCGTRGEGHTACAIKLAEDNPTSIIIKQDNLSLANDSMFHSFPSNTFTLDDFIDRIMHIHYNEIEFLIFDEVSSYSQTQIAQMKTIENVMFSKLRKIILRLG